MEARAAASWLGMRHDAAVPNLIDVEKLKKFKITLDFYFLTCYTKSV